jgi:PadR family transcriptional regulator, regulatory protein AphA
MKKVNKSRYAILGMLMEKSRSGYSILNMMQQSTAHFWQESDASVYPMLKKLEAEGMVTSQSELNGKRERNIFSITAAGKKEFSEWLSLPAEDGTHRDELLLKLFFSANATKQDVLKQLLLHQKKVKETEQRFRDVEEKILSQIPDEYEHKIFWVMTLQNGKAHAQAELKWIAESIGVLEKK